MADKSFGIKELSVIGSSGTPQIQSVENLNIRVGVGSTVIIGDSNTDFSSPAPSKVDPNNTAVLNVGVVTANYYFGTFKGSIDPDIAVENAKHIEIQPLNTSDSTHYLTFVDNTGTSYEDLYANDTDLKYFPTSKILVGTGVSLGGYLHVTGISTHVGFSTFGDISVTGMSTHVGFSTFGDVSITGMSTHVGFSTFGDVSITGMSTFIGIATFRKFVGVGTDALPDFQFDENKIGTGHTLAVAGIVTAYEMYATKFYGPVKGTLEPTGNVTINDNLIVNGNTTLGDESTDTITATAKFDTSLLPSTSGKNLGSDDDEWNNIWIDGTANLDTVDIDGGAIDGTTIGGNTAAVGSFTDLNASGTSTLDEIYTNSIYSKDVSSLTLIGDKDIVTRNQFGAVDNKPTANDNTYIFHGGLGSVTGSYTAYDGEILTFEFSEDGKDTRVFQFKYSSTYDYDASEKCSIGKDYNGAEVNCADYKDALYFRFSKVPYSGYSKDFHTDVRLYYILSNASFKVRLIPKITAAYSVGIGTTNPVEVGNQGAVLGVAGIVTAHEYYGTFKGDIANTVIPEKATNSEKINIQSSSSNATHYLTFVDNTTGYEDLYVNTGISYTPDVYDDNTDRGTLTITGNLSIGGTVTYEDVTNVDSIGIVTAGKGLRVTEGGIVVNTGIATFHDAIEGVSIGATAGNLYLKSGKGYLASRGFNYVGHPYNVVEYGSPVNIEPIFRGNYIPVEGEIVTVTLSEDGKETRTFYFEYVLAANATGFNGTGFNNQCTISNLPGGAPEEYNQITTATTTGGVDGDGVWRFSKTALGGYSTNFETHAYLYYTNNATNNGGTNNTATASSFKIEIGTVLSIKSAVGIGTSNPFDPQTTDRGAVLAVAGIVTATEYYGTFKGTIDSNSEVVADKSKQILIQEKEDDIAYQLTFTTAANGGDADYQDLYVDTTNTDLTYNPLAGKLSVQDLSLGGDLEVTGISTFTEGAVVTGAGVSIAAGGLNVKAGIATFYDGIETNSIYSKSVSSLELIGTNPLYTAQGPFDNTQDYGSGIDASTALLRSSGTVIKIGDYVPYDGEILTFEFSNLTENQTPRVFQFRYNTSFGYTTDGIGRCSFNDSSFADATQFQFSNIAYGGYSTDWSTDCLGHFTENSNGYRIKLIPKITAAYSVGIGTTNPVEVGNQGAVLGVAGIVTAHEYYGTFKGTIETDGSSGTIENAKKVQIQEKNDGVDYQIPFTPVANGGDPDYQDLYVDTTDADLTYNPLLGKLSVTDLSLGGDLEVTGISTFTEGAVVTGIGVSIHSGGLNVKAGISTFTEGAVVTGIGVSIAAGGLNVTAGIATFSEGIETPSINNSTGAFLGIGKAPFNADCVAGNWKIFQFISSPYNIRFSDKASVTGDYTPTIGGTISFTFSADGKETRTFVFEFKNFLNTLQAGECGKTTSAASYAAASMWSFSTEAQSAGSYSINFERDCFEYYRTGSGSNWDTDDSFRVSINSEVREVLSISSGGVGIGTSVLTDTVTNQGSILAVAGIVTATEYYGTFKGTIETDGSSGTIENAKKVEITNDTSRDGLHYIHFGSATSGYDGVEVDGGGTSGSEVSGLVYQDGKLGVGTVYPKGRFSVFGNKDTIERFGIAQTTGTDYYPWNTSTGEPIAGQYQISDVVLNGGAGEAETTQVKGVLNMGASYLQGSGFAAGSGSYRALKLYLYKDTDPDNSYGLGMSDGMLEIQSNSSASDNKPGTIGFFVGNTGTTGIKAERLRITNDGDVGIGTTNPIAENIKHALSQVGIKEKVLAVGIVTANEYYGTFKGDIDSGATGTIENANKVKTQNTNASADFFLTFVNSNNSTGVAETIYTDGGLYYNPSTNVLKSNQLDLISTTNVLASTDPDAPSNRRSAYNLGLVNSSNVLGSTVGLAFAVTSASSNNVGAVIYHKREGGYTKGSLIFATKESASGNTPNVNEEHKPIERLRITSEGHVGIGTIDPTVISAITENTKVLAVGIVTTNSVYGKLNDLTYPSVNGTDGNVLTSDGLGNVAWEPPAGGSGASSVNVSEVTGSDLTDNTYHLTFVSGAGNNQDVRVSAGVTVQNNTLWVKDSFVATDNTSAETLMNQAQITANGGVELRRNNHNVTSGGPFIDFTKNIVNYPDITTSGVDFNNDYFTCSTDIIQREWTTAAANITLTGDVIGGNAHYLASGDPVRYIKSSATGTDAEIGGLTPGITYYAIVTSTTHFKFCATEADAKSASPTPIEITSIGSGDHTFKLGTLNTGDVLVFKSGNADLVVNRPYFVISYGNNAGSGDYEKFYLADSVDNALKGTKIAFSSDGGTDANVFEVDGHDFDARIQLNSLGTDESSILFRTPVPGTSLPSAVGKSQVRMEVTREGAVVSGIMTVAHSSDRLDGTSNYIQAGIGTNFKDANYTLTRDDRSKMMVFDPSITSTKKFVLDVDVFGYGDSLTIYNADDSIVNDIETGANVEIWLAGTNVKVNSTTNNALVHLSSHAMATLTYVRRHGAVDSFVITGGGVYV